MKKKICLFFVCVTALILVAAQDFNPVAMASYKNGEPFLLKGDGEHDPYNEATGNRIFIDENGIIYIYSFDRDTTYELNNYNISKEYKYDFSEFDGLAGLSRVTSRYFYYKWTASSCIAIDRATGERVFDVRLNDLFCARNYYYDEKTDLLFFIDKDKNLYCVEHPSLDQKENRLNLKNNEETLALLRSGKYAPHILIDENNTIEIENKKIGPQFEYSPIGKYSYRIYSTNVAVYEDMTKTPVTRILYNNIRGSETNESVALHPCGDIYILRYDSTKKLHTLYCVQNTWDSAWRNEWFKTHR